MRKRLNVKEGIGMHNRNKYMIVQIIQKNKNQGSSASLRK